jgi:heavy metal sensor kinase
MRKVFHRILPLGVRIQLTIWYIIVFTVLIVLFGGVFYVNLQSALAAGFDDALRLRTQQIVSGIKNEQGNILIQDVTGELPGTIDADETKSTGTVGQHQADQKEMHPDVDLGTLVRVLNGRGQTVYVTPAFLALQVPPKSISQPLHGISWQGTVIAQGGQAVRLYSTALTENGSIYGVVQVGESLTPLGSTLRSALIELLLVGPFVLLLGAVGSYWLAAHAFRPITRLTRTAQDIEAGDLHQRVPVPSARDEVQDLALTFNDMIERLERAFTRQRRFVADASHELRTPVAAIRSMTEVALAQDAPLEEYAAVLCDVNAEAERLGHLIRDLLDLARIDEGKTVFEHEPVRLDRLVQETAATTESLATERDIVLEVQANEPVTVLGDEAWLIQIVMNLIDNALTYTNAGGKVTLNVEVKDRNAYLTISDTGIGIAPEHMEHIFERFYRVDAARSSHVGGSGLGLAIIERVVRLHGGAVTVESQLGRGSTFTVMLPLAGRTAEMS